MVDVYDIGRKFNTMFGRKRMLKTDEEIKKAKLERALKTVRKS